MHTNTGLVAFAHKALAENWGYCLGSFGNILTDAFLNQKLAQGGGVGAYNTKHKAYLARYRNKRVSDCYGLVKAYVWWTGERTQPKYIPSQDRNQEGAYRAAREKGPLSNMPEIPGLVLWMRGHAGIYIGNGEFIECAGAPKGMVRGRITNGRVVKGSPFTHWFKDTYITYAPAVVSMGSKGPAVSALQTDLNKLGYKLAVDSSFGPATDKAVRDFQRKNGLAVDGIAGPATLDTIKNMLSRMGGGLIKVDFLGQSVTIKGSLENGTNYVKVGLNNVPVRALFEAMGFKVGWDQGTQTILVRK